MSFLEITFNLSAISEFGIIVAIVGYLTVFFALVLMYFIYNNIPKLIQFKIRQKLRKEGKTNEAENNLEIVGEVNAAISTALYLYLNEHDEESHKLTIKQVKQSYTPWSSKIYNVNDYYKMQ
ncbi:MAG: OadG family protein [Bacteroidales bacterium]|nr:OadG family protein [Bacteroidales bacterium]